MRPKAEWAIDSEPMRARGIIVNCFQCHESITNVSEESITPFFKLLKNRLKSKNYTKIIISWSDFEVRLEKSGRRSQISPFSL